MVRIVQTGFNMYNSPTKSRHDSGDLIDENLAQRAVGALDLPVDLSPTQRPRLGSESTQFSEDTDGSMIDFSDHDHHDEHHDHEETHGYNDELKEKRKQRRRERNKASAQAYRQRRRQTGNAQQKELEQLESQQRILLNKIQLLEAEKQIVEGVIRKQSWPWQFQGAGAVLAPAFCPPGMMPCCTTTTTTTTSTTVTTPVTEMEMEGVS